MPFAIFLYCGFLGHNNPLCTVVFEPLGWPKNKSNADIRKM